MVVGVIPTIGSRSASAPAEPRNGASPNEHATVRRGEPVAATRWGQRDANDRGEGRCLYLAGPAAEIGGDDPSRGGDDDDIAMGWHRIAWAVPRLECRDHSVGAGLHDPHDASVLDDGYVRVFAAVVIEKPRAAVAVCRVDAAVAADAGRSNEPGSRGDRNTVAGIGQGQPLAVGTEDAVGVEDPPVREGSQSPHRRADEARDWRVAADVHQPAVAEGVVEFAGGGEADEEVVH